jgi:rhamnosyltransferase
VEKVIAIIVTYNPDMAALNSLLDSIESQFASVIIIDNGSSSNVSEFIDQRQFKGVETIEMGFNSGIGKAINTGINVAYKKEFTHIVLFDQDSKPAADMISKLLETMNDKQSQGIDVAAVGPKYIDVKGGDRSPFVKLVGRKLQRIECPENETVIVDHLISSGSLISKNALDIVGLMEEKLFIDYVDTEWCLRAINKGYNLYGVGNAKMQHDLGDETINILGRVVPSHAPLRHYYLIRNGIWLLRQSWVSSSWKRMDSLRLCKIFISFSVFSDNRLENLKMMSIGVWHAIMGRMGKY